MIREKSDLVKNISVYVHIPFCVRKCNYCDFLSFSAPCEVQDRYLRSLVKEIKCAGKWLEDNKEKQCEKLNNNILDERPYQVKSIFFGGGTPSSIDPSWITKILDTIRESFDVSKDAEITTEMNPGTVTPESLSIYKKSGINRISIGCQSLNDDELKELGRIHDSKTFYETFRAARQAGFDNINVDLMSALPGQSIGSYTDTLNKILELRPEHISAYSLIIEEGTPFYEKYKDVIDRDIYDIEDDLVKEGVVLDCVDDSEGSDKYSYSNSNKDNNTKELNKEELNKEVLNKEELNKAELNKEDLNKAVVVKPLPSEAEERQMYEDTIKILKENGYHRYEVSNYARDDGDYECYHNKAYWKRADYLGFGIGAAGMVDDERFTNTDDINIYCDYWDGIDICDNETLKSSGSYELLQKYSLRPLAEHDKLSTKACMEETMFLGLRMDEGVSIEEFELRFGKDIHEVYGNTLDKLSKDALVIIDNDHLKLTEKGLEISNAVLSEFLLDD